MENLHRLGDAGHSEPAPPNQLLLADGVSTPSHFLKHLPTFCRIWLLMGLHLPPDCGGEFLSDPAAPDGYECFEELYNDFVLGAVPARLDACAEHSAAERASPPPKTLEIFPSWPMRLPQSSWGSSQSAESSGESGSAQNTISAGHLASDPLQTSKPSSWQIPDRSGRDTANHPSQALPRLDTRQHRPQDKRRCFGHDGKPLDAKTLRRLAQNREAARKSRLRKKAYVRQLETCRLKLSQMEQDLQRARSQGLCAGSGISPGATMFDVEYARWLEEDRKLMAELAGGLRGQLPDGHLHSAVDECLAHYDEIFRLKAAAASSDVFHVITGMWAAPAERCFLWMGGFRPSEILKMLIPQLDPLTEQQLAWILSLQESSQQAEEALSQGLEQLQQSLTEIITAGPLVDDASAGDCMAQMALALAKLSDLRGFVHQADNLRQQTLQQVRKILTLRQAARCFLAIGEYHGRLRSLGSLWALHPHQVSPDDPHFHFLLRRPPPDSF